MHPGRAVTQPLDKESEILAVERDAVIFGEMFALLQWLAEGCAPKRHLAVVLGGRDVDDRLVQLAVVSHGVNLRGLAAAPRP